MNFVYEKAVQSFLRGHIDWMTDSIRMVLLSDDYEPATQHEFFTDIAALSVVSVSEPLIEKSIKGTLAHAGPITFNELLGKECVSLVIYQDRVKGNTSRLILFVNEAPFLPYVPNGSDLEIYWPNGIFTL